MFNRLLKDEKEQGKQLIPLKDEWDKENMQHIQLNLEHCGS